MTFLTEFAVSIDLFSMILSITVMDGIHGTTPIPVLAGRLAGVGTAGHGVHRGAGRIIVGAIPIMVGTRLIIAGIRHITAGIRLTVTGHGEVIPITEVTGVTYVT